MLTDVFWLVIPAIISASILAAQHWFPWNSGAKPLGRIQAYIAGTSVVVGVPVATMLLSYAVGVEHPVLFWAALLVVNTGVSGGTVMLAYWIDSKQAIGREDVHAKTRN